jgi:hypothetical protein
MGGRGAGLGDLGGGAADHMHHAMMQVKRAVRMRAGARELTHILHLSFGFQRPLTPCFPPPAPPFAANTSRGLQPTQRLQKMIQFPRTSIIISPFICSLSLMGTSFQVNSFNYVRFEQSCSFPRPSEHPACPLASGQTSRFHSNQSQRQGRFSLSRFARRCDVGATNRCLLPQHAQPTLSRITTGSWGPMTRCVPPLSVTACIVLLCTHHQLLGCSFTGCHHSLEQRFMSFWNRRSTYGGIVRPTTRCSDRCT